LEARLFEHLKQKIRDAKARRLRKAAAKKQAEADAAAIKAGVTPHSSEKSEPATREFFEEDLEAREYFDEELEAREYFDEELDARNFRDFWNGLFHRESAKAKAERLQREANRASRNAAAADAEAGHEKRDYLEDELEMREFDEVEDLLAREYFDEEELAARDHNLWQTLNAITHTFTPEQKAAPHAPAAAAADAEPKARDVFDEFDLRDFVEFDELD